MILEHIITKITDLRLTARTCKNCIKLQRTKAYSWKKQQSHLQNYIDFQIEQYYKLISTIYQIYEFRNT